jgi:hypothetical protein
LSAILIPYLLAFLFMGKIAMRVNVSGAVVAVAALIAGCGGGGGSDIAAPTVTQVQSANSQTGLEQSAPVPQLQLGDGQTSLQQSGPASLITVPEYLTQRVNKASTFASALQDAKLEAAQSAESRRFAVADLASGLSDDSNMAVVPPLTYSIVRTLGAAASGDSLLQLSRSFELAPSPFVAAQQTKWVTSQLWANRGQRFEASFLAATDVANPSPTLSSWTAAETGFSDRTVIGDSAFAQSMSSASAGLAANIFTPIADVRMVLAHSLKLNASWADVKPFDGLYAPNETSLVRMPMFRLTTGVKRYSGNDFRADMLTSGDYRVLKLSPSSGTLKDFASARLKSALDDSVIALLIHGVSAPAGEMVLPKIDLSLPTYPDNLIVKAGVTQVYDEVNANLKAFDGLGGTFVQQQSPNSDLNITANGLGLSAAHAMAFTFSKRNVNGPGGSSFAGLFYSDEANWASRCANPAPDLRSFFLAILDVRGWVVSLVAVQNLPGTQAACFAEQIPSFVPSPFLVISPKP